MGEITLYTHAVSQSSEKVRWALDAAGIHYHERVLTPFVHTMWLTSPGGGLFTSMPVLEEAGGTFTDWRGEPTIYSGQSVATNGVILHDVLNITRQHS